MNCHTISRPFTTTRHSVGARNRRHRWLGPAACLLVVACSNYDDPEFPDVPPAPTPLVKTSSDPSTPPAGAVWRKDVVATVDQGLGKFLQKLRVEPALEDGKFSGFRVVELREPAFWANVDLRLGDVIKRVNGMPIERDTQAYAAFESLRKAGELEIELSRDGSPHTLSYRILDQGGARTPKSPDRSQPQPAKQAAVADEVETNW